mgnify:CR=1 FL=1
MRPITEGHKVSKAKLAYLIDATAAPVCIIAPISSWAAAVSGFVGEGMLDCSVVGDIFAAPGAQRLFQALQLMKREAGILLVVLNTPRRDECEHGLPVGGTRRHQGETSADSR